MLIDRHEAVLDVRFGGADRDEKFFSQTAQGCQQRMSQFHVQRILVDFPRAILRVSLCMARRLRISAQYSRQGFRRKR